MTQVSLHSTSVNTRIIIPAGVHDDTLDIKWASHLSLLGSSQELKTKQNFLSKYTYKFSPVYGHFSITA